MGSRMNLRCNRVAVVVLVFGGVAHAEKPTTVVDLGVVQKIDRGKLPAVPLAEVKRQLGLDKVPRWDLEEVDRWLSHEGSVALLQQSFGGVEIDGSTMTVELNEDGGVIRVNRAWIPETVPACSFGSDLARERARAEWGVEDLQPVYWPKLGGEMECAFRYRDEMFKHVVSGDGRILEDSDALPPLPTWVRQTAVLI